MFNIKYNFLVLIQIVLNTLNAILLVKVFGVSGQVDAYLLGLSIITTAQLIISMFSEQFLIFYTDLKNKSVDSANKFYNSALFLSAILGIAAVLVLIFFKGIVFKTFAFNVDVQRLVYLDNISVVLFWGMLFVPINSINQKLLNAESKYSIPYILTAFPTLFLVLTQLGMYILNRNEIIYLAYGQTLGWGIATILGTIFIAKTLVPFKFVLYHPEIKLLFKNSFATQLGGNLYNVLMPVCTNNILVTMSAGYVSYFYYAKKIIDTLKLLTFGPSARILRTNLSNFWVSNDVEKMKKDIRKFLKGSLILMFTGIVFSFLLLPIGLKLISMGKLSDFDIKNITFLFLSLCPWYLIAQIEIPYILTIFISKKSKIVILTNILFIIIFFSLAMILKNKMGLYSIAFAAGLAQLFNYTIFKKYAKKLLKKHEQEFKQADVNQININSLETETA